MGTQKYLICRRLERLADLKRLAGWKWLHIERYFDGNYRQKKYFEIMPEAHTIFARE